MTTPIRNTKATFSQSVSVSHRLRNLLYLTIFLSLLGGPTAAFSSQTQKVSIGYQPIVNGPLWIARHEGYFKKAGLKINWVKFTSGPAQFAALQGGRIDLAWGGIGTFSGVYANGANIRLIATLEDYNPVEGLAVPNNSAIKQVSDLAGHTVGLVTGSDAHYGLLKALEKEHVDPSSVHILSMQPPTQVAALLNGNVDAVFTWAPFLEQLSDRGAHVIFRNSQLASGPGFLGWVAKQGWLAKHKAALVKLFKGWDEGYDSMQHHPAWAIKYSVQYTGMADHQAKAIQKKLNYFRASGMVTPTSPVYWAPDSPMHRFLKEFSEFGVAHGVMKKKPDIDQYVDTSFEAAYKSGLK